MTPIYVPSPTEIAFASGTSNLLDMVNHELKNYAWRATDSFILETEDVSLTDFQLSHRDIVSIASPVVVTVNAAVTTPTSVDYDSGLVVLPACTVDDVVNITYDYKFWSDVDVRYAINFAIEGLYPRFYLSKVDAALVAHTDANTYILPTGTEVVQRVEVGGTAMNRSRYEWYRQGDAAYLKFYTSPGTFRVHVITRPQPLASDTDTLSVVGLPKRAAQPIILLACWHLLSDIIPTRMRSDQAVNTQGGGMLSPRQIVDGASNYQLRYEVESQRRQMHPWRTS